MKRMNDLRVLENDLVPVYETSTGEKVVYGTELHKVLGVRSKYRDWIRNRINDCDAVEHEDYEPAKILAPSGQNKNEHIIKLDTAKEMAMLERNEKGKQVRRYFIQVEKKYKEARDAVTEFNERVLEILQNQSERIEGLEKHLRKNGISDDIRVLPDKDIRARTKRLNKMTARIADLRGTTKMRILHLMYRTMEERNCFSLDSYRSVYCSEKGISEDTGMLNVICYFDNLYKIAVEMCEEAIERYEIFGGKDYE